MNELTPALFVIRKEIAFLRPFVIQISRTEDDIEIKYIKRTLVQDQLEDFTVFNFHLNRFELMKRLDWKDCTQHGIHFKDYDVTFMRGVANLIEHFAKIGMSKKDINTAVPLHFPRYGTVNRNGYLINISATCLIGRISSLEGHAIVPAYRMLNFTMKFKDSKFTEVAVNLAADPAVTVEILSGDRHFDILNSKEIYQKLAIQDESIKEQVWRPKLKLTQVQPSGTFIDLDQPSQFSQLSPNVIPFINSQSVLDHTCTVDQFVTIKAQLIREWYGDDVHHVAELELEAVNGYLPKNRIQLDENGCGTFRFYALHLEPGDTMRVKAGFRYQVGMADLEFKVV